MMGCMKYAYQRAEAEKARLRRIKQRAEVDEYVRLVKSQSGITPTRTTIAAHFHKNETWLSILLRMKEQDEKC
jgi:hypothetical protein